MIPVGKLSLAALASFALWKFFQFVYHRLTSPIRSIRGPNGASWIYGNVLDIYHAETPVLEEWVKQYGSTMRFKGFFNSNELFTMDTRAINHILTHSSDYQKPLMVRGALSWILGEGVLVAEGDRHRQQRRIMSPAFSPAQIRGLTEIIHAKAVQLRGVWLSEIDKDPSGSSTGTRIDVMPWMSRMTLDVIGLAGFNYNFDALNANEKPNELNEAFTTLTAAGQSLDFLFILQTLLRPLRLLPTNRARRIRAAQRTMTRIGKELLLEAKAVARMNTTDKGEIEKSDLHGRDLFSLLVKANMATDIPEGQRLSDEDVLAQVPTFLVAGHETTSTATTWALYALTTEPRIQTKLREELLSVETDAPSMDELMALPYLDAVVRETLRVYPPLPNALRIVMKDDVLPVEKPITDKYGVIRNSINVRKGDLICIPMLMINRSQELWGHDAHEFKPERWESIPEAASQIPGVWAHQLAFLGGPRGCIAYRFSLVEIKAFLFTLVRTFEFKPAVSTSEIDKMSGIAQWPILRNDPKNRPQLPLLVKPYQEPGYQV